MIDKNDLKKTISITLSVLFLVSGGTGSIHSQQPVVNTTGDTILYVGGMGPGNYSTIQDALDAASDGDTVFVFEGIYHENLKIERSIQLIGEHKENTLVDGRGTGNVIEVKTDNVSITGFTIQNSGKSSRDAGIDVCKLDSYSKGEILYNVSIFGNKICHNISAGIYFRYVHYSTIYNNNISGKSFGIIIDLSSNNKITGNLVQHGYYYGIYTQGWGNGRISDYIYGPMAENNIISGNTVINYREGIMLGGSSLRNVVTGNNIVKNRGNGVITAYCFKNEITKNNIIDNDNNACIYAARLIHLHLNTWDANYWGEPKDEPVPITGRYFLITLIPFGDMKEFSFFDYDNNPADEPYDI
jgi:parallel beta-helix repeat protein